MSKNNKIVPYPNNDSEAVMRSFDDAIRNTRDTVLSAMMRISPYENDTQRETQRAILNELLDLLVCLDKEFKEQHNSEAITILTKLGIRCSAFSFDHYRAAPGIALAFINAYDYGICKPQLIFTAGERIPSLQVDASPLPEGSSTNTTLGTPLAHNAEVVPEDLGGCCLGNCGFSFFGGGSF